MPSLTGINLNQTIYLTEAVKGKLNHELDRPHSSLRKVACHAVLFDSLIDTLIDLTENGYVRRADGSIVKISSMSAQEKQVLMKQHSPSSSKSFSPIPIKSSPTPVARPYQYNNSYSYSNSCSNSSSRSQLASSKAYMGPHSPSRSLAPLKSCLKKTKSTKV